MCVRLLHDSGGHALSGLASVVRHHIVGVTKSLKHIMASTRDVTKILDTIQVRPSSRLVRLDVENFFMDAEHADLVSLICSHASLAPLKEALNFMLLHQYVEFDNQIFQVVKGSGMGSQASSDICDLAFHMQVESKMRIPVGFCSADTPHTGYTSLQR